MARHSKAEQTRDYRSAHRRQSLSGLHSFLRAFRRSPLGVWVGEGLKEEIAGERGPWRASRATQPNILWSSFLIVPAAGLWFTHTKRVADFLPFGFSPSPRAARPPPAPRPSGPEARPRERRATPTGPAPGAHFCAHENFGPAPDGAAAAGGCVGWHMLTNVWLCGYTHAHGQGHTPVQGRAGWPSTV